MSEKFDPQSQEGNPENSIIKEKIKSLDSLFLEVERVHEIEGREKAKNYLTIIYDHLISLNKRDKADWENIWIWNEEGELTEAEFNELNLRRKKLSNAIGIKTASGEIRHDLNDK